MILAIGSGNDFVHVYRNENDLVADNAIGAAPGRFSGPIEFFDSDSHRFTGVNDGQGNLRALNSTGDPADLPALLQRVRNAFDRVRSFFEDRPEESAELGPEVIGALGRLPGLSTSKDLNEFLGVFVADPMDARISDTELDPQSRGHNALHRMGIDHG